jgi:hypothetical protein
VYRLVQEGLTNALRHAPGAATAVDIRTIDEETVVEIANGPATRGPTPTVGTGSGLVGLAERLRLYHGTLDAHPIVATGGFRLRARIPAPADPEEGALAAADADTPSAATVGMVHAVTGDHAAALADAVTGDQLKWTNAAGSGGGVVELVLKRAAARSPN